MIVKFFIIHILSLFNKTIIETFVRLQKQSLLKCDKSISYMQFRKYTFYAFRRVSVSTRYYHTIIIPNETALKV